MDKTIKMHRQDLINYVDHLIVLRILEKDNRRKKYKTNVKGKVERIELYCEYKIVGDSGFEYVNQAIFQVCYNKNKEYIIIIMETLYTDLVLRGMKDKIYNQFRQNVDAYYKGKTVIKFNNFDQCKECLLVIFESLP